MTLSATRRQGLTAIAAALAFTFAMPVASYAAERLTSVEDGAYETAAVKRKKLNTGICTPGHPDFNPDACYADIKS